MNNPITFNDYMRASCKLLSHGFLCFYTEKQLEYWRNIVEEYEQKLNRNTTVSVVKKLKETDDE